MTLPQRPTQILKWESVTLPDPQPGQAGHWSAAIQQIQAPIDYEFRISEPSPERVTVEILHQDQLSMILDGRLLNHAEAREVCEFIAQTLSQRQYRSNGHNGHHGTRAVGEALSPIGFG